MAALLDLPLREWSWEEDASRSTLVDGNMEAIGTAAWTPSAAVLSKESVGAHSGTQWLKITDGMTYQSVATVGAPGRVIAWMRGDGAKIPQIMIGSTTVWTGTNSVLWQPCDATGVCATAGTLRFYCNSPGGFTGLDDVQYIPLIARTKNVGLLGGSAELGNGVTGSSFPTQIGGMQSGMVLASGSSQVLQWYKVLASGTYTVAMTLMNLNSVAANGYLFDARESGGVGYALFTPGNLMGLSSGQPYLNGAPITTGVSVVPYGTLGTLVCSGVTLSSTTKVVFGASSGIAFPWNGRFYNISIYPGTLTATQARAYHERQMSLISMR